MPTQTSSGLKKLISSHYLHRTVIQKLSGVILQENLRSGFIVVL